MSEITFANPIKTESIWPKLIIFAGIVSAIIVIINIVNIIRAKKYCADEPDDDNVLLHKIIFLERFLFWPKVLKGIAVFTILLGAISAATDMICVSGIIKVTYNVDINSLTNGLARGIQGSMWPLAVALMMALGQFFFYYLFRLILHLISSRSTPKTQA